MNTVFGTDGIRCRFGTYPLTFDGMYQFGFAFAQWALTRYGKNARILIAHDTRISCNYLKAILKASLLEHELVLYDAGILPTPVAATIILTQQLYDCGIIITASHNKAHDNGIKIIDREHGKLLLSDEDIITANLHKEKPKYAHAHVGSEHPQTTAFSIYSEYIQRFFPKNFLTSLSIVLDCANGAAYSIAPAIFELFGAQIHTLHTTPTGHNINEACGSTAPEQLQQEVINRKAHIGFAFDGDGDRVIAVNFQGLIKNGDDLLALLSLHPCYAKTKNVIGTVMANEGLAEFLAQEGKILIRVAVGDKYVAEQMRKTQSLLGGEQSGHIITGDHILLGDGIFTALRLLEVIIATNNFELATFKHFPQKTISFPVTTKKSLTTEPLKSLIRNSQDLLKTGRLLIRYSGTENCLRIMAEDHDENNLTIVIHNLKNSLLKELS